MMVSLVVLLAVVVALLVVLVVGLLRSYGEVLRRLHEAGIGVEAEADGVGHAPASNAAPVATAGGAALDEAADITRRLDPSVAPPRPSDALVPAVADISGVSPTGDAVAVGLHGPGRITMLAFLSSGCGTCANFWGPLRNGERLAVGDREVRTVVVTGGPEHEHARALQGLAGRELTVVMSDDAWRHYAVPATPYFVLIDGAAGVLGEGSAMSWGQLVGLMDRAVSDRGFALTVTAAVPGGGRPDGVIDLRSAEHGPVREARVDAALLAAGIGPGDQQLYRSPLDAERSVAPGQDR